MNSTAEIFEQVHHMALDISAAIESQRVLRSTIQNFARIGNLKNLWIALEKEGGQFTLGASLNNNPIESYPLSELVRTVLHQGQALLSNAEGKTLDSFETPSSVLCLPLNYRSSVLGAILLESDPSQYLFGKTEIKALGFLANHVGTALAHARLFEAATQDGMTKLGIHRYFKIRLQQELERCLRHKLPLSLVFIDVDFFKKFNDTYGHQLGDKVLIHVAEILRAQTRGTDVCARYGGEEFAVILPEARLNDAVIVAQRMRKKIEQAPLEVAGQSCAVTVSIGVADLAEEKEISSEELIKRADQMLYQAKRQGRNCVVAWQGQNQDLP